MQGQGKFRQSRSTKPLSWEPANPGQGSWSHATTTPHHRATGIGVALWTPICPGVSSTGTGMGDTCPSNISREKLRSGWRILFSSQSGGKFLVSQDLRGLPCQGPRDGGQAAACSSPPASSPPKPRTQRPMKHLLTESHLEQEAAQLYEEYSPHPRGCTSS